MEKRQSNFELLRILSIFMIAIFHCALYSGFTFTQGLDANGLLIKTFWMFGEAGVNLFILISGYFLITSRFRWKKLVLLAAEVWFYCWTTAFAAFLLTGKAFAGKRDLFMNLFPVVGQRYWFATAYVVLYLLSPFLNIFLRAMDQKTYRRFLGLVLLLYSVIPTFTGLATNSTEDFLFFNRLIWMMILYSVAAYIRLYPEPWMSNAKWGGGTERGVFYDLGFVDRRYRQVFNFLCQTWHRGTGLSLAAQYHTYVHIQRRNVFAVFMPENKNTYLDKPVGIHDICCLSAA